MKIFLAFVLLLLLVGCSSTKSTTVDVPVFTKPEFTLPQRPVLRGTYQGDYNKIVKDAELDELDLLDYSLELENIIKEFK